MEEELEIEIEDEDPFTMIPIDFLRNPNISNDAKALYAIIKSYINIPNFTIYQSTLKKCMNKKDSVFKKCWKELKDLGYLKQSKKHINGRYKYSYKLSSKGNFICDEIQEVEKQPIVIQPTEKEQVEIQDDCETRDINTSDFKSGYKNLDSSSEIPNETKDELINYEGMDLTDDQYYQIEKLIKEALVGKIDASKGNVISYCQKRYDSSTRTFKKKNGDEIKSIYGYVKSTFRIKAEQDKLKESSSQSSSFY